MTAERATALENELRRAAESLEGLGRRFALVGGLAVSIRGEVRFTRDVDLAVVSESNDDTESLVRDLRAAGYDIAAIVEQDRMDRIATVRLRSRARIHVDLLVASSGTEPEIVDAASVVEVGAAGILPVARAEDLLATKILSMSERTPQDRIDARGLVLANPELDLAHVRERLVSIHARGFDREQDLGAKLEALLAEVASD